MNFILSKGRNKMGWAKAEDYVYVRHNLMMAAKSSAVKQESKVIEWSDGVEEVAWEDAWQDARVQTITTEAIIESGKKRAKSIAATAKERIRPEEDLEAEKEAQEVIERAAASICEGGPKGAAEAAQTRKGRLTRRPSIFNPSM